MIVESKRVYQIALKLKCRLKIEETFQIFHKLDKELFTIVLDTVLQAISCSCDKLMKVLLNAKLASQ